MSDYNLGTASGRIVINGDAAKQGFTVAQAAGQAFLDDVQSRIKTLKQVGTRLTQIGAAGVAGFGLAIKVAGDFETQLSAIKAVSGATVDQMELIRKKALQLGADTAFSASESAQAMEELIKAGLSVEDVLNGAADATVALAAAGGVSLPEAATIASNAMNQFNLTAEEVPKVADLIAGAANASAIDVGEFGMSLQQVGAVAHLAGLSLEDTAVAIAEMGNAGIKGSDAGTSLKTMLMNLVPVTDKQISMFRKLGLITYDAAKAHAGLVKMGLKPASSSYKDVNAAAAKYVEAMNGGKVGTTKNNKAVQELLMGMGGLQNQFFDAQGNTKKLADIQDLLSESTKNMTKEQKLAALEVMFGSDSIRAAAVMADAGAEGFNGMATAMGKVSAADVAATRLDNLSGSVEQLKGSFETAMISIGQIFIPVARDIIDQVTSIINWFNDLPDPVKKAITFFFGLATVFTLLTGLTIKLVLGVMSLATKFGKFKIIGRLTSIFKMFFTVLRTGAGVTAAYTAAMGTAATMGGRTAKVFRLLSLVLKGMRAAWLAMLGPVGIAIAIVAALVAGVIYAYKHFEPFRQLVDRVAAVIRDQLAAALQAVLPYLQRAWEEIQKLGNLFMSKVVPAVMKVGRQIIAVLIPAAKEIASVFMDKVVPALLAAWNSIVAKVLPSLQKLWAGLKPVLVTLAKVGAVIVGSVLWVLRLLASWIIATLLPTMIKVFGWIATNVIPIFAAIAKFIIGNVLPILIKLAGWLVGTLLTTVINVFQGVVQAVKGALDIVLGIFFFFKNLFTGNWSGLWESIKQIASGIWNLIAGTFKVWMNVGILKVFGLGFALLRGVAAAGWGFIRGIFSSAGGAVSGVVRGIWNFIKSIFTGGFGILKAIVNFGWKVITGAFTGYINLVRAIIGRITSIVRIPVQAAMNAARSIISGYWNIIRGIFNAAVGSIRGILGRLKSAITGVFSGAGTLLKGIGEKIVQGFLNGVKGMFGKVKDTFAKLTSWLPDWKGPEEKDKKLLTKNGQLVMQGFIVGVEDQIAPLRKVLQDVTTMIPRQMPPSAMIPRDLPRKPSSSSAPVASVGASEARQINFNVYNPVTEKDSVTLQKTATRLGALGVI